jgi:hypothetical protein
MIKKGSRWWVSNGKKFVIIDEVEVDGHTWIYYRDELGDPPNEFSCYKESFKVKN